MQYLYLLAWVLAFEDVEDVGVRSWLPGGYVDREELHFMSSGFSHILPMISNSAFSLNARPGSS